MFKVSNKPQLLYENTNQYSHTMTTKFLFISKRSSPGILEAVEFLTTRVTGPYMDYYKKLFWVIKYLRGDP